jgi:SAM-dependent methyltransferase
MSLRRARTGRRPAVLAPRTLANSHPVLLARLAPGMTVLDVGCGPGGLTAEMARRVDPGHAVGLDLNEAMIAIAAAEHPPTRVPNLVFSRGDIRASRWEREFDLVNACRVLQWLPDPEAAVAAMARAAAPGGLVVVQDYDHAGVRWAAAPAAWTRFHEAYLAWRTGRGLDNALGTRLPALLAGAGLRDLEVHPRVETVRAGERDFFRVAGAWRIIADGRGREVVAAGYLREAERRAAVQAFTAWLAHPAAAQTTPETAVVGRRAAA